MIQQSEFHTQFQPPPFVNGSSSGVGTKRHAEAEVEDDGLSAFLSARARLLGIAYRVLRSSAEAEDIVQDVWIRWQTTDRSPIRDATAFLATTTMRLAINVIQSARWRRETDLESSLPQSADTSADPDLEARRKEALRTAVVVLLERLSPAERAAYVLREAFDYSYREIANVLRVQEANARQIVNRARRHVVDGRHGVVNSAEEQCFRSALTAAVQNGALAPLESFFVGVADGTVRKDQHVASTRSTFGELHCDAFAWTALETAAAA
jgi:RNA polymerase sigma-70 factor (ECF subfamily)